MMNEEKLSEEMRKWESTHKISLGSFPNKVIDLETEVERLQKWIERFASLGNEDSGETPEVIFEAVAKTIDELKEQVYDSTALQDKIGELKNELEHQKRCYEQSLSSGQYLFNENKKMTNKLITITKLIKKWRRKADKGDHPTDREIGWTQCADELEKVLGTT